MHSLYVLHWSGVMQIYTACICRMYMVSYRGHYRYNL